MRKNISLAFLLLALIAVATLLLDYKIKPITQVTEHSTTPETINAQPAPDFAFSDITGRTGYRLSDFKGKTVILHFWATWCAPCVKEYPKLTASVRGLKKDIVVLAISSDADIKTIRTFIDKTDPESRNQKNIYTVWDEDRSITHDLYQTFAYPETIIIDREGRMVRKIPGDADWTGESLQSYLKSLIAPLAESPAKP